MVNDVISVKVIRDYILHLKFDNGIEGDVDISSIVPFEGIFENLKNPSFFNRVRIDPELGTIVWDNGADISPECLYENLQ